jgi:AraC-like DNA-binding protein
MKPDRLYSPHLVLNEVCLPPGGEWNPPLSPWSFIFVSSGVGYWLHPRLNQELPVGTAIVLSDRAKGYIRASQLEALVLHYYRLEPAKLSGLVTLAEQRFLQEATAEERFSARFFSPDCPTSAAFGELRPKLNESNIRTRLQLLLLFIETFGDELQQLPVETHPNPDARERLLQLFKETSASELLEMNLSELVQRTNCTHRHFSRLFNEIVGMSFREKQSEMRLQRARELLATTEAKIVDVALESGYQSLSLFNLMFKRRFGLSPGKWREQLKTRAVRRKTSERLQVLRA